VEFEGSWADCYRVHMFSRIASRILLPVSDFEAYNQEELYFGILKKHDFTKYITPRATLRVEAHVRENPNLTDQRFVMMKVKDAIVDQFWKKFNERPNIGDEQNADLRVVVRIVGKFVSVAIDLTGESLAFHGYRRLMGEAPLRETLGAGLVRMSGWEAPMPLVDPFCGSGTILIEAALSLAGYSAAHRSGGFAFQRLETFQEDVWDKLPKDAGRTPPPSEPFLFGFDKDPRVLDVARSNARAAGVEKWISFKQQDAATLKAPVAGPGMIITNPPYGERLEDVEGAKELMNVFSKTLKTEFKNWTCWILNGNPEVITGLRLKAERKIPVWNAQIDCRFLKYPIS
jgi:putative N6-adenine-specific DNA methylase